MGKIEEVKRQPQCNHKELGCASMEKQAGVDYGRCLLRNPFDCPLEPKPDEGSCNLMDKVMPLVSPERAEFLVGDKDCGQRTFEPDEKEDLIKTFLYGAQVQRDKDYHDAMPKIVGVECALTAKIKDAEKRELEVEYRRYFEQKMTEAKGFVRAECQALKATQKGGEG